MSTLWLWTIVALRALAIFAMALFTLGLAWLAVTALYGATQGFLILLPLGLCGLALAFYLGRNCRRWALTTRLMIDGDMTPSLSVDMRFLSWGNLVMVAAFCGVLCAIALPMFSGLIRKSSEGASKGNLAVLRARLQSHQAAKGSYPIDLADLGSPPVAKAPNYHQDSAKVAFGPPTDAGGWLYENAAGAADFGTLRVNCTHTDTKGKVWTTY